MGYYPGAADSGMQVTRVSAETRSQAQYARLFWRPAFLRRHLELTAAGRYTRDSKNASRWVDQNGDVLETDARSHLSYRRANPEGSLIWHWNDDISTYAKVATAYEAGGALENAPTGAFVTNTFRPESSTTYEIGLKSSFLSDRLHAGSLAADYTAAHLDRKDVLVHLDYIYRTRMFAEGGAGPLVPGNGFDTQPAYGLLNGRITLSQETNWAHRVKISIWGRNMLNRKYYQPAVGVGSGVMSFGSGYTTRAGACAEPMSYGVSVRYEY